MVKSLLPIVNASGDKTLKEVTKVKRSPKHRALTQWAQCAYKKS